MNRREFADWQNYHHALFGKFGDWMLGMASDPPEPQEIVELRENAWFEALQDFAVDDAKAASVALMNMPPGEKPKWFDEHLAVLVRVLRKPKAEIARRQVQCQRCRDTGMVGATAKPGMCIFSVAGLPIKRGKYAALACTCYQGTRFTQRTENPLVMFDPSKHEEWSEGAFQRSQDTLDGLRESGQDALADAWERFLASDGPLPRVRILK